MQKSALGIALPFIFVFGLILSLLLVIGGGDNPYWITVRVKVDGGISPEYYVRLHRTSERPNKWKASHILEPQAFNSYVNSKTKN